MHDGRVHYITNRHTIYGVHKQAPDDSLNSKTCILCFSDQSNVHMFADKLRNIQKKGSMLERCIYLPGVLYPMLQPDAKTHGGSLMSLEIQSSTVVDIMKMCHLNFFDMYMVFNMDADSLHCYVYETMHIPTRDYMTMYYNYLLRL
jgi:hypothetical protein